MRHRWTGFVCEVKSLRRQRLQGFQDATARWPHHHHCRGGGGCWKVLELPFSTCGHGLYGHVYDQDEHCPIRLRALADSQSIGGVVLEAMSAYGVRLLRI